MTAADHLPVQFAVTDVDVELVKLAFDWPNGSAVRHESGWTGRVVDAGEPEFPVLGHDGAHAVLCWRGRRAAAAVAVEWTAVDGRRAVAWYAPHVLRRVGGAAR